MAKFGKRIVDVPRYGEIYKYGETDDCWVKFDVSSEGDVAGLIQKEGDIYVCRLKWSANVKWECQCGPCDLPEQSEGVNYSMLWGDTPGPQGGPHRQHDVKCIPDNGNKGSSTGTLKGPFVFTYCVKTEDQCSGSEGWSECVGGGERGISKETIIPLSPGSTVAFCDLGFNSPRAKSGAIAQDLKAHIDALPKSSHYFDCD